MSTYKEIVGQKITKVSADPGDPKTGQMWYNSTTGTLRGLGVVEATSSGSNMINKRSLYGFGVGTGTAGLVVGGLDDSTYLSAVEEYNGSGWAAGGTYPTSRYSAGTAGTQTAAIAYCGRVPSSPAPGSPTETFNYDGSTWTSGNSFPTGGNSMQGIGAVNTAVVSTEDYANTNMHHWNGTSWTAANARNTAKGGQAAFGTQTAAVLAGGFPSDSNITEVYDGTNWTSGNTMNNGRQQIAGSGTQTNGLAFGGDEPPTETATTRIESWDGTSWSTSPATLATARTRAGTGRNTASGTWIAGGIGPGGGGEAFEATEEYNKSTNTVTAAAWASGGSLNTGRAIGGSAITSGTSGIVFGGSSPYTGATESYNGSSWSELNDMNTARSYLSGFGTSTAAVGAGGYTPGSPQSLVEEWNGSAWSEETNLPASRKSAGNCGTLTAGLIMGGASAQPYTSNLQTTTFEYDGTNWTTGGALPEAKGQGASGGTQTASFYASGVLAPGTRSSKTAFYNGSTWSEGADVVSTFPPSAGFLGSIGTTSAGLAANGTNLTNIYDGTVWVTAPNYSTTRNRGMSGGTSSDALAVGGYSPVAPNYRTDTEEFTGETSTANIANFTTS